MSLPERLGAMKKYTVNARSKELPSPKDIAPDDTSAQLRLAGVIGESTVDGPGLRFVVFAQGCPHKCEGCHNPQTHSFDAGFFSTVRRMTEVILHNRMITGVTLSGGEPFCQAAAFAELAQNLRHNGLHVITYTGYTLEQLRDMNDTDTNNLLLHSDWLVDGKYIEAQKDLLLKFRGSKNQRIIDLKESFPGNITEIEV